MPRQGTSARQLNKRRGAHSALLLTPLPDTVVGQWSGSRSGGQLRPAVEAYSLTVRNSEAAVVSFGYSMLLSCTMLRRRVSARQLA